MTPSVGTCRELTGGARAPGTVVLSVDAELGWGFHHCEDLPAERLRRARLAWRDLLELLDEFEVPATWAVVGHLLLETCHRAHAGHPAGQRCCERDVAGLAAEEVWFGQGLVDEVLAADVPHEVASHGFTHLHFQHDRMDPQVATDELAAGRAAAAERDLDPTTFVFPVNRSNYRSMLADHGYACYRGPGPSPGFGGGSVGKLGSVLGRGAPPVVVPTIDEYGLVDIPASAYLFGFDGLARSLVETVAGDPMVGYVRRGLDQLVEEPEVLHLWLHPHNLQTDRDVRRLRAVMEAIEHRRERGKLRVATMGTVAEWTRAAADVPRHQADGTPIVGSPR